MKTTRLTIFFVLSAASICWTGCETFASHTDPLVGWQKAYKHEPDQAIEKDCQDYIQSLKLSPEKGTYVAYIEFFEDGTGQHAEKITISLNKTDWEHVLIYDKDDKRIKTIKYVSGHSSS
jgi:hypothetical protein